MNRKGRNEAILRLWPAIQAKASYLAATYHHPEPDDIANELVLVILDRSEQVASFLSQQQTYILNFAQWRWQDAQRRERHLRTVGIDEPLPHAPDSSLAETLPDPADTPAEAALAASDMETLARALGNLPEQARELLVRVYGRGESQRSIAQEMGRPEGTIRRWVTDARRMLAAELGA